MLDPLSELSRGPAILDALAACRAQAERVARLQQSDVPVSPLVHIAERVLLTRYLLILGRLMTGAAVL